MTPRQASALKVVLPFIGTIFALGIAWNDLRGDIDRATPEVRFIAESIRTDGTFKAILENDKEVKQALEEISRRLLETCLAVRSGCR